MFREAYIYLNEWKQRDSHKPLIIRGARQVGKTWSVDNLAKSFPHYIKIDFEENPEAASFFRDNNIERIAAELALSSAVPVIDNETLLFFDECQLCPDVFKSLRYFYEKRPNLHVIAAGSLLDFTLNELQYPMPVGRVEFLYMYPLSFTEYLQAAGRKNLSDFITGFTLNDDMPPVVHNQLLEQLRLYYFIGGMPEAVKEWAETGDLLTIQRIQTELSTSIRNDFTKYGTKTEQPKLIEAFQYLARNSGVKIKYSNISKDARSAAVKNAIKKLEEARIVHKITHSAGNGVPIGAETKPEHFKTAFIDTGLSNRISGLELTDVRELITIREGALAEQFAAQELAAASKLFEDRELYYWIRQRKNSNSEVDFLTTINNKIVPIEIKAGTTGSLKSLHIFMASKSNSDLAVRLSLLPPSFEEVSHIIRIGNDSVRARYKLLNLPLYMVSQINRIAS